MKTKAPQFELNFGKEEPFRLTGETRMDVEPEQQEIETRRRHRISAERAQWWFEQMKRAT